MKKLILLLTLTTFFKFVTAQTTTGPAETKLTDALCDCLNNLDRTKITDGATAKQAFMNCFAQQLNYAPDVATERGISMSDKPAMRKLGEDIGINLMKQKCDAFMFLAVKMGEKKGGDDTEVATETTTGGFKRIDVKGFNYIVLTDAKGSERSFIWLRQFPGSENFMGLTAKYAGKKLKVSWQEMEVYLPAAKGYYKVKEIVGVEVL
jgi:hypothetical protein